MRYVVKIPRTSHTNTSSFLGEVNEWAHHHCGANGPRWTFIDVEYSETMLSIAMCFKNEKDAIMFKLRWL